MNPLFQLKGMESLYHTHESLKGQNVRIVEENKVLRGRLQHLEEESARRQKRLEEAMDTRSMVASTFNGERVSRAGDETVKLILFPSDRILADQHSKKASARLLSSARRLTAACAQPEA